MSSSMLICRFLPLFARINHLELKYYIVFYLFSSKIMLYVRSCSAGSCFATPGKLQHKHPLNLEQEGNAHVMFEDCRKK